MSFNMSQVTNKYVPTTDRCIYPVSDLKELNIPTYDGSGQATHPSVVYVPAGFGGYKYWMAMTPYPFADEKKENPSVLCSNDGIKWEVPAGLTNPIMDYPGVGWLADTELIYNWQHKKLMLWWTHFNGLNSVSYYSESTNGSVWTTPVQTVDTKGNPFTLGPVALTYHKQNLIIGWSSNRFSKQSPLSDYKSRFRSTDGITWEVYDDVTDVFGGTHWHDSVLADTGGFHFISAAHGLGDNLMPGASEYQLHYGYSLDGQIIVWDAMPILLPHPKTADRRYYRSCMIPLADGSNRYRIYAGYTKLNSEYRIGYFDVVINNPTMMYFAGAKNARVERVLWKEKEIRDTVELSSESLMMLSNYTHKAIAIWSSLDQPVTLRLTTDWGQGAGLYRFKADGEVPTAQKIEIPAGLLYVPFIVDAEAIPALKQRLPQPVEIRIKCPTAPTIGKITVRLIAWND